jgi:hypothetical protein
VECLLVLLDVRGVALKPASFVRFRDENMRKIHDFRILLGEYRARYLKQPEFLLAGWSIAPAEVTFNVWMLKTLFGG